MGEGAGEVQAAWSPGGDERRHRAPSEGEGDQAPPDPDPERGGGGERVGSGVG